MKIFNIFKKNKCIRQVDISYLSDIIKEYINKRNLTFEQFSFICNVSYSTLKRFLNDPRNITLEKMIKIMNGADYSINGIEIKDKYITIIVHLGDNNHD